MGSIAVNVTPEAARRVLHFHDIDDVMADVEVLAAAEQDGKLRRAGNWTFGQTLGHMATWADYAYDGTPLKPPLLLRWALRPMKKRFLYKPMRAGGKIPGVKGGTLAIEPRSSDEGLGHFTRSFARLKNDPPARPHMIFGPLTHDEWISMHLRHSELHLSFFRPE